MNTQWAVIKPFSQVVIFHIIKLDCLIPLLIEKYWCKFGLKMSLQLRNQSKIYKICKKQYGYFEPIFLAAIIKQLLYTHVWWIWPLNSEIKVLFVPNLLWLGTSILGPSWRTGDVHTVCQAFGDGTVSNRLYDLDLSLLGYEHWTYCMLIPTKKEITLKRNKID